MAKRTTPDEPSVVPPAKTASPKKKTESIEDRWLSYKGFDEGSALGGMIYHNAVLKRDIGDAHGVCIARKGTKFDNVEWEPASSEAEFIGEDGSFRATMKLKLLVTEARGCFKCEKKPDSDSDSDEDDEEDDEDDDEDDSSEDDDKSEKKDEKKAEEAKEASEKKVGPEDDEIEPTQRVEDDCAHV